MLVGESNVIVLNDFRDLQGAPPVPRPEWDIARICFEILLGILAGAYFGTLLAAVMS